jgi:ribosome-associated protein
MDEEFISKTRRKQDMHALQALGVKLLALSPGQLGALALPEDLALALREARNITSREARRRQLQYIGRLMRDADPEPIRRQLAVIEGGSAAASALHRRIEQWRARLIDDDGALTDYMREYPGADLQALRAVIRSVRREQKAGKPPRAHRELYRMLREAADLPDAHPSQESSAS